MSNAVIIRSVQASALYIAAEFTEFWARALFIFFTLLLLLCHLFFVVFIFYLSVHELVQKK